MSTLPLALTFLDSLVLERVDVGMYIYMFFGTSKWIRISPIHILNAATTLLSPTIEILSHFVW